MKKMMAQLHRKLDTKVEKISYIKKHTRAMKELFDEEKLKWLIKDDLDFYKNEVIYYGVLNKRALEETFREACVEMADFYGVLSYEEKRRLMNCEIDKVKEELPYFMYEGQRIYIPFFDVKMNAIYEREMALFEMKQYHSLMLTYKNIMREGIYSYEIYKSSLSSLSFVCESGECCGVYCNVRKRLYFIRSNTMVDFITLPTLEREIFEEITRCYFARERKELMDILVNSHCVLEKVHAKICKHIK